MISLSRGIMAKLEDVKTPQEFDTAVATGTAVVHFWAPWCEPCKHMDQVLVALASDCPPGTRILRVEAEEVEDLAERYDVSAVPHFLLFKAGKLAAAVEGADAGALTSAVSSHIAAGHGPVILGSSPTAASGQLQPTPPPKRQPPPEAEGPIVQPAGSVPAAVGAGGGGGQAALTARIEALLQSAPVMLFMKGSPDAPRCGFSAQVVQALREAEADFQHFDILQDPAVREGLKAHSNWPTYPQLYVRGELLGGADIVLEMAADGELQEALQQPAEDRGVALQQRLKQLTTATPVVLFIKGSRDQPYCRFSKAAVAALEQTGTDFSTFDILTDDAVREGLKKLSNWPTYPQLYVGGELVGGADIIAELAESGELKETIAAV